MGNKDIRSSINSNTSKQQTNTFNTTEQTQKNKMYESMKIKEEASGGIKQGGFKL